VLARVVRWLNSLDVGEGPERWLQFQDLAASSSDGLDRTRRSLPEARDDVHRDVDNRLTCTPCTCGPPQGTGCTAAISVYAEPGCATPLLTANVPSTAPPTCVLGLQPGDLRSVSATWLVNDPGTCEAAGGDPIGEVTAVEPSTFCCVATP
jgi:hypothetical protein